MELLINSPTLKNDPKRYLVAKEAEKVKKYLIAFNLPVSICLEENCKQVAMNKSILKKRFDLKKQTGMTPKNFEAYENSEHYDNDLENHYDNIEAANNFEGFEENFQDFLPIVAALGTKIVKGGAKLIKNKIQKNKARKVGEPQNVDPSSVYSTLRSNVLDVGLDKWLSDDKKNQIEKLLKKGESDSLKAKIKSQLVEVGVDPTRFHSFEDANGNFSGKSKDILSDILGQYKDGETAKAKNEAYPKLIMLGIVLVVGTYVLTKSV